MELQNVVIVDGARSAFGRGGRGKLVATRLDEAGAQVLALLDRNPKVSPSMIEDIGLGNVGTGAEFAATSRRHRRAPRGPAGRGLGLRQQPPVRLQHGDPAPHRAVDHGRRHRVRHRARHRAHGPLARRRRRRRPKTRVTEFNKRRLELNEVQRNMAPDHGEDFSRRRSRTTSSITSPITVDDADRAERRRGLRPHARGDGPVRRREPPQGGRRLRARASTRTRSSRSRSRTRSSTTRATGSRTRRGKTVIFDRDECVRPGTNMEKLGALNAGQGHRELRRQRAAHHRRQLLPDQRRRLRRAAHERGARRASSASTPLARIIGMGVARREAAGHGPRPDALDEEGAARTPASTADQIDRVEFNEAFAAQVLPSLPRARHPDGPRERQRRLDRHRPPARRHRRAARARPSPTSCAAAAAATASPRSASAPAWASRTIIEAI